MTLELFSLAGKKALVTGASRGIGQVIAVAFAEAGADVAITARGAEGLAATARRIRDFGREAVEIPADLTTQQAAAGVVATAIDRLGQLDIVVNNAGGSNFVVPFLDMRLSGWEKVLRLNLDATMWVCQTAGAHMTARGSGSVINVASVAGLAAAPFLAPYGAAKAGGGIADQDAGQRVGPHRRPGERALPWLDRDRPQPHAVGHPGRRPGDGRDRAHGPLGQAGGNGRPRHLPRQRRLVVHDRPGPCHRRRPDQHRLTPAAGGPCVVPGRPGSRPKGPFGPGNTRAPARRAGAHTRLADERYSVHQSSSFSGLPAAFWAGAAAVGAPLPACGRGA